MEDNFGYTQQGGRAPAFGTHLTPSFLTVRATSPDPSRAHPLESSLSLNSDIADQSVVHANPYPFADGDGTQGRGSSDSLSSSLGDGKDSFHSPFDEGSNDSKGHSKTRNESLFSFVSVSDLDHTRYNQHGRYPNHKSHGSLSSTIIHQLQDLSPTLSKKFNDSSSEPASLESNESTPPAEKEFKPSQSSAGKKPRKTYFWSAYGHLTLGQRIKFLYPAMIVSLVRGLATPVMTKLLGQVSSSMSKFNAIASNEALNSHQPPLSPAERAAIRNQAGAELNGTIRMVCGIFAAIALAVIILGVSGTTLWLKAGEDVGQSLRLLSFDALTRKPMSWYDGELSESSTVQEETKSEKKEEKNNQSMGPSGAGGMMTRFNRDTDEVRMAAGMPMGTAFQQASTIIACMVVALISSWSLTLVVLASVPLNMFLTSFTLQLGAPWILRERSMVEKASGQVERTVSAISTVKAFNAQDDEAARFQAILKGARQVYLKSTLIWSSRYGISAVLTFSMFVQGFWYGTMQVKSGKMSPGDVMTVFWAALMASTRVGSLLQMVGVLHRGNIALKRIHVWFERELGSYDPATTSSESLSSRVNQKQWKPEHASVAFSGSSSPAFCMGSITFYDVCFRYPPRPEALALEHANIHLPSGKTTYLVGGSGSGKSTVAGLLLRLYAAEQGCITIDGRPLPALPAQFLRSNIAAVTQVPVVFSMSVRDNIALGACAGMSECDIASIKAVPQDRIEAAAKIAMLHDFVTDLPQEYDTLVGVGGVTLSGGQGQRLALARAVLCNPSVLILDEATSALDVQTRTLVHSALTQRRQGRTTLVITHDMSQIEGQESIYVLDQGKVAESGSWKELSAISDGVCARILAAAQDGPLPPAEVVPDVLPLSFLTMEDEEEGDGAHDDGSDGESDASDEVENWSRSMGLAIGTFESRPPGGRSSWAAYSRRSLRPISFRPPGHLSGIKVDASSPYPDTDVGASSQHLNTVVDAASDSRSKRSSAALRRRRDFVSQVPTIYEHGGVASEDEQSPSPTTQETASKTQPDPVITSSIWGLLVLGLRQVQSKGVLTAGLICTMIEGFASPGFSLILGQLMSTMGGGLPISHSYVLAMSMALLALAIVRGVVTFGRYMLLESASDKWVNSRRMQAYNAVLSQHKSWFDLSLIATPQKVTTSIAKDGEDARKLISVAMGEILNTLTLLVGSLAVSFAFGWELTFVGLGFGICFLVIFGWNAMVLAKAEARNKLLREECARGLFLLVAHIRAIRSMALEPVFGSVFNEAVIAAHNDAVRVAPLTGFGSGAAEGMQYLAEAGIYGVACYLMSNGTYTLTQVTTTLNVLLFAVSFAGQGAVYIPMLSKCARAFADLEQLACLPVNQGPESEGDQTPQLTDGRIQIHNLRFAYPSAPQAPVLAGVNLSISPGETVALVGSSGCGKSTLAALLQRLYEPDTGVIRFDGVASNLISVKYLREKLAVVSQNPDLFPVTIENNIAFGSARGVFGGDLHEPLRASTTDIAMAADEALVTDFVSLLPDGMQTFVGERQGALSSGQAQRVALARMMVRKQACVRILDECTSALDPATQLGIMDKLFPRSLSTETKHKPTTVVVTHKIPIMRRCDRVIVLDQGRVVEFGPFDTLLPRGGPLARLASTGGVE